MEWKRRAAVRWGITLGLVLSLGCMGGKDGGVGGNGGADGGSQDGGGIPTAPIDATGGTGWRDSSEPLCRRGDNFGPSDLWADERGVFVVLPSGGFIEPPALLLNDGRGWWRLADLPVMDDRHDESLTGIPGGPLFIYQLHLPLTRVEMPEATLTQEDVPLMHLFAVHEGLAYGGANMSPHLVIFDGTSWGPFPGDPPPYECLRVWADEEALFCGGRNGVIMSLQEGDWMVHDTATLNSIRAIWGFAGDDVWAGTNMGQLLHWDGAQWTHVTWPSPGDGSDSCRSETVGIDGMWGMDGQLFFHTYQALMRYDGADFEVLGYWPGEETPREPSGWTCRGSVHIRSIWGTSPSEVYLVVVEGDGAETRDCSEYLLWWDGAEFHWF